jgi:hypothetical protein
MTRKTQEVWRMFKVGSGFWKGSKMLSNCLGKTKDFDLTSPILVNISFAGEVYLKCLLLIQTGKYPKRGREAHDLKRLYDELPKTDQAAIDNAYKNNFENSLLFRLLMKPKSVPKLRTVLAGAGETFINVRYGFDSEKEPPGPTVGLQEFVEAVQQRLLAIKPELEAALDVPIMEQSRRCGKPAC